MVSFDIVTRGPYDFVGMVTSGDHRPYEAFCRLLKLAVELNWNSNKIWYYS